MCIRDSGGLTLLAAGGVGSFEFSIDNGLNAQSEPFFPGLMSGSYMLRVVDEFGCVVTEEAMVDGPTDLELLVISDNNTNCNFANGGITVSVTGGTPPFTYSIDGGVTTQNSEIFTGLEGGMYTVVVQDAGGCLMTEVLELDSPECFGAVGDLVFEDLNGDGVQGPGEPGIPLVRVELFNNNDVLIDITFTDENGNYLFDEVRSGDYYIGFEPPEGFDATFPNQSINTNDDSNLDGSNGSGTTPTFNLGAGETDLSIDAGFFRCIPVGESVWFDFNENDLLDDREQGINGIRVEILRNVDGEWILYDFTTTGPHPVLPSGDGYYKFCVPPGDYHVRFVGVPATFVRAVPNVGFDESRDSDVTDRFGLNTTDLFSLSSGDEFCQLGAGFYIEGVIESQVWIDSDRNGLFDNGEQGMEGVTLLAINAEGNVAASSTTDANGIFTLDMLPKDFYYLEIMLGAEYVPTIPHQGQNDMMDSDLDGANGRNTTRFYMVLPGERIEDANIGVILGVVPVEWVDITAIDKQEYNEVTWHIASETNVSHYVLEHSHGDTRDFVEVDQVESETGHSKEILRYTLPHYHPKAGVNYYRVKQLDFDGKFSYSSIVSVLNDGRDQPLQSLKVYPNPTKGEVYFSLEGVRLPELLDLVVIDNLGRIVHKVDLTTMNASQLSTGMTVDLSQLREGIYTAEVQLTSGTLVNKFVIAR